MKEKEVLREIMNIRDKYHNLLYYKRGLLEDWDTGDDLAGYIRLQSEIRMLRKVLADLDNRLSGITPFSTATP